MNKVLVIAAHPDDEVIGCGGSLAKHASFGDEIYLLTLTNGVSSRENSTNVSLISRENSLKSIIKKLGVKKFWQGDFPDNSLDSVPLLSVIKFIEKIINVVKPSIVYTHYINDLNIDHRLAAEATLVACRPNKNQCVKKILGYEVLSSTEWAPPLSLEFKPNYITDISDYIENKIDLCKCYEQEFHDTPNSRSLEHVKVLSQHRGYSFGLRNAEAFVLYRSIN